MEDNVVSNLQKYANLDVKIKLIATPYNVGKSTALKFLNTNAAIFKVGDDSYTIRFIYDYGVDEEARRLIRKKSRRMQFLFGMILYAADTLNDFSQAINFVGTRVTFEIMTHLDYQMVSDMAKQLSITFHNELCGAISALNEAVRRVSDVDQYAWIPEWGDPANYTSEQSEACTIKNLTFLDCTKHFDKIRTFNQLKLENVVNVADWMQFKDHRLNEGGYRNE